MSYITCFHANAFNKIVTQRVSFHKSRCQLT